MANKICMSGLNGFIYGRVNAFTDSPRSKRNQQFDASGLITKFEKPANCNTISKLSAIKKLLGKQAGSSNKRMANTGYSENG